MYKTGIDIGSTTIKIAVLNNENKLIYSSYKRHQANIKSTLIDCLLDVKQHLGNEKSSINFTGSAGLGVSERYNLPFVQEVVAAGEFIAHYHPEVNSLIDIGGEDSKLIIFSKNRQADIRMNGTCAGGTGAFIDQMADLMNLSLNDFNRLAANKKNYYPVASRCGVFAKTDIQNLLSKNIDYADIIYSVFRSVALQILNTLSRGVVPPAKILFSGGPFSFFPELKKIFLKLLKYNEKDSIEIDNPELVSAIGAAVLASNTKKIEIKDLISKIVDEDEEKININRLQPIFNDFEDYENWNKTRFFPVPTRELADLKEEQEIDLFLGIDSGSTTTKMILIDQNEKIVKQFYHFNNGHHLDTVKKGIAEIGDYVKELECKVNIRNGAVTGYGEELIKAYLGIEDSLVETLCHFKAAQQFLPEVDFILDIGGQDMKAILIKNGQIEKIEINEACSSGCGSFIHTFCHTLNYKLEDFSKLAALAKNPVDLGSRCTVFMNSLVKQSLRQGSTVDDIAAGLSYSIIKNCLNKVLKIRDYQEIGKNIVVQGGTFLNPSIQKALENILGFKVVCPQISGLMGAYGAALYAKEVSVAKKDIADQPRLNETLFTTVNQDFQTNNFNCKGCTNQCLVTKINFSNQNHYYFGNKCENVFDNFKEKKEKGFNFYGYKQKIIFEQEIKTSKTAKIKIGIPRVLNIYDNFPFWQAFFIKLNFEVVTSNETTAELYDTGVMSIMSDNICLPAKVVHGHIIDLQNKEVDPW